MGRAFSTSYLAGDAAACALLPQDFRKAEDRQAAARRAAARATNPALMEVLREQQAKLPASAARQRNLEALTSGGGTGVVVTGQQVGLFLGPLYTFYKAASAIAAARAIEAESGVRCVPLFWLQTEDHDFAEIATCTVAGPDGVPTALSLPGEPAAPARVSVAHRLLGPEVDGLLDRLTAVLGPGPAAAEVLATLRAHYLPGRTWAAAFGGTLAALFADDGLLFLDPRDERIARAAAPLYRRAIVDAAEIEETLAERAAELARAGLTTQVELRPGSPLVFFHLDAATGSRFRLSAGASDSGGTGRQGTLSDAQDPRAWTVTGAQQTVTHAALLDTLEREPLRFSTSALLRPLVQDTLLPTVAYVGGPAEVSYTAQVAPLYPRFQVSAPLCIPRARFVCSDARSRRLLAALDLQIADLVHADPELWSRLLRSPMGDAIPPGEIERRITEEILPLVEKLGSTVVGAAPALTGAAERTRASVAHALSRLARRYGHDMFQRDTVTRDRLRKLKQAFFPGGAPQERVLGWPTLAARVGPQVLKRAVMDSLSSPGPFVSAQRELHL